MAEHIDLHPGTRVKFDRPDPYQGNPKEAFGTVIASGSSYSSIRLDSKTLPAPRLDMPNIMLTIIEEKEDD